MGMLMRYDAAVRKARPRMHAVLTGRTSSDRAVGNTADRNMLARYSLVTFGVRMDSSSEATTLAATLAYIKALNPGIITLNYQVPWETDAKRLNVTRSGTTATYTTPDGTIPNLQSGRTFAIRGFANSAYNGDKVVTLVSSSSFTATVSGSPANESGNRGCCLWNSDTTLIKRFKKATDEDWFLRETHPNGQYRNNGPGGTSRIALNLSHATAADANGMRYAQWLAREAHTQWFSQFAGLDGAWMDNLLSPIPADEYTGANTADYNRDGSAETASSQVTNQLVGCAEYAAQIRADAALRSLNKSPFVWGNANELAALTNASTTGVFDGDWVEHSMPLSSSKTMANRATRYQGRHPYTRFGARMQSVHGELITATAYSVARTSLAAALILTDGFFSPTAAASGYDLTTWHDEFGIPIGKPIEPIQSGPRSGSWWWRRYTFGVAIVNDAGASATLDVAGLIGAYRKMGAADSAFGALLDSTFNNGANVTSITLGTRVGCILLRQGG